MGLDFQNENEIAHLDDKDFNTLYPAFNILNKKTGIIIDEYSDSLLSPDHAKILLDSIQNNIEQGLLSANTSQLLKLFQQAIQTNAWIKIIGD